MTRNIHTAEDPHEKKGSRRDPKVHVLTDRVKGYIYQNYKVRNKDKFWLAENQPRLSFWVNVVL